MSWLDDCNETVTFQRVLSEQQQQQQQQQSMAVASRRDASMILKRIMDEQDVQAGNDNDNKATVYESTVVVCETKSTFYKPPPVRPVKAGSSAEDTVIFDPSCGTSEGESSSLLLSSSTSPPPSPMDVDGGDDSDVLELAQQEGRQYKSTGTG
jgi:hypothetical protein